MWAREESLGCKLEDINIAATGADERKKTHEADSEGWRRERSGVKGGKRSGAYPPYPPSLYAKRG